MNLADFFRQLSLLIGLPAVLLGAVAAATIVIVRDWRIALFAYAVLSTVLALLLSQIIPPEWALLQAIVGGLIAVMLYLSARQLRWNPASAVSWEERWPQMASLGSFRVLAIALAVVTFVALREDIDLPQVDLLFRDTIFWLMLIGLLGLALHEEPLHAGLSLLTVLGGSEILLFSLMQSRTMIGVLEGGQLLLGLAISYLMVSRGLASSRIASGLTRPGEDA
jgi:uncharacterized MnhB-related membrane protein